MNGISNLISQRSGFSPPRSLGSGVSDARWAYLTLTTAQLDALGASSAGYQTIVAAQGANKIIIPILQWAMCSKSNTWSAGPNFQIGMYLGGVWFNMNSGTLPSDLLSAGAGVLSVRMTTAASTLGSVSNLAGNDPRNQPLLVRFDADTNPGGQTATAKVGVLYCVATVPTGSSFTS